MSGREAAKKLVEDIVKQHGYVRASTMDRVGAMSQEARREIEDAFLKKDELIGANVITLARNLYSSNARFVFELLQNADDNQFDKAARKREQPHVSFDLHLHQHRIVVECNEDGFTKANLVAISNLGKSSKSNAQAYIGEKGIGFKSIFKVAYKVLIQSNDYTFSFNHRKGDSGMGMICPEWEPDVLPLDQGVTRMTLFLHEDEQTGNQADDIRDQFKDLHEEMLLFLKNLKKITVRNFDDSNHLESTKTYQVISGSDSRNETEVTTERGDKTQSLKSYFHVTKYVATDLPRSDTRDYAQAEIVIAFPMTQNSVPIEFEESVFAFLPLCDAGFKFVLHADFVTTANRQDVETTSPRNKKLISGIADAFAKGVTELCGHQSLQYQWMRYLPNAPESMPRGSYWSDVAAAIRARLRTVPLLRPAKNGPLRLIGDLKRLAFDSVDQHGNPLFDDMPPEIYLSSGYGASDLNILTNLGLKYADLVEHIARVRHDLSSFPSRMKQSTDEDWQTRAAKLLALSFQKGWRDSIFSIKSLDLLPLKQGNWVAASSGPIFYPETLGLEIPVDIDMRLLDPKACANSDRRKLFNYLGAQVAGVELVRQKIFRKYQILSRPFLMPDTSTAHLRFLYLSHHLTTGHFHSFKNLLVITQPRNEERNPSSSDTYLQCDDSLGASKLLAATPAGLSDDGAPGFKVHFVDDIYLRDAPERPSEQALTWTEWLCKHLKLRTEVRLVNPDGNSLSDACLYVAKHRPKKFLAMLNAVWPSQRNSVLDSESCLEQLRSIKVLCQNERYRSLRETYIPTKSLKNIAGRFLSVEGFFPWLRLESPPSHHYRPQEWDLITDDLMFGFSGTEYRTDLDFCLDILCSLQYDAGDLDPTLQERVYDLYLFLEAKVCESRDKARAMAVVHGHFEEHGSLYVPSNTPRSDPWRCPVSCVWDSPLDTMETKVVLKNLYSEWFAQFRDDEPQWQSFFTKTLGVEKCTWRHIVGELKHTSESGLPDLDRVVKLYSCLDEMVRDHSQEQALKETFATERLICSFVDEPPTWHIISDCLWESATRIPGKTPLNNNDDYGALTSFFINRLKVPKMTIGMLYDKLKSPSLSATVDEIKGDLLEFNALLGTSKKEFDPEPIRKNTIFPVKLPDGEVTLASATDSFSINDRSNLAEHFIGKAPFLDFEMETVHRLRPLVEWAGLQERYLSRSVKEISTADKESTQLLTQRDRAVNARAHALLRIAKYCGSPRTENTSSAEAFYKLLRSSKTVQTNSINTTMILSQGKKSYNVETSIGNALQILHDKEDLKIFVPRKRKDCDLCFSTKLPKYLFDWMMDYPTGPLSGSLQEGLMAMKTILTAQPHSLLEVLVDAGIPKVSVGQHDPYDDVEEEEENLPTDGSFSSEDFEVITPSTSPSAPPVQARSAPLRAEAEPQPRLHVVHASPPPVFRQPAEAAGTQYRDLIRKVVAAGRRAEIPSHGAFNMAQMQATLAQEVDGVEVANDYFVLRYRDRMERDRMIGAAGEVFVFEMLSRLDPSLPSFGRANWQSTIRHYVDVHEDYANLGSWAGYETADITYSDTTGALTALLGDKGYLGSWGADSIARARPRYFIEVKATTGRCDTPFYMSKNQYRRMQDARQRVDESRQQFDQVYVIFRVYNLGLDSIGVRVLVDPEGMRQRNELSFTADSWSVTTATG